MNLPDNFKLGNISPCHTSSVPVEPTFNQHKTEYEFTVIMTETLWTDSEEMIPWICQTTKKCNFILLKIFFLLNNTEWTLNTAQIPTFIPPIISLRIYLLHSRGSEIHSYHLLSAQTSNIVHLPPVCLETFLMIYWQN